MSVERRLKYVTNKNICFPTVIRTTVTYGKNLSYIRKQFTA